jgi:two-component system chemotaxis response regulator CheY
LRNPKRHAWPEPGVAAVPKKVLVVDDSQSIRKTLAEVLLPAGYDVLEAENGLDGAQIIETTPELSLVICDVNMPQMSGIEMLARVKADSKNAKLLVLMLTTEGRAELIREAKQAGACGWIVKPLNPEHLLAAVRKLIGA